MKILFAPSEAKKEGGKGSFTLDKLCCPSLNNIRAKLINEYEKIILNFNLQAKKALTGLKKESDLKAFGKIMGAPVLKAITRYSGVAYEYLSYENLPKDAQTYIDENVFIFSNLFGVLQANDEIPLYKVKQGANIGTYKVEALYFQALKEPLDEFLGEEILDLSPTFYKKFYKPNAKVMQLKFLKNNKIVSHWAKAYRGVVLKEIAKNNVQSFDAFLQLQIPNLAIKEIKESKRKTEVIFEII